MLLRTKFTVRENAISASVAGFLYISGVYFSQESTVPASMLLGSKWTRAHCAGACLLRCSLTCNAHCQGLPQCPAPVHWPLLSILVIIPGVCPPPQLTVIAEAVTRDVAPF